MSALRVHYPGAEVRHVDPHTRQDYRPVLMTWVTTSEPVIVRPAERVVTHAKPTLRREPRAKGLYLAHLSDADILVALVGRSQEGAAAVLGCSQSSIARRLRQMRAGVGR